MKEFTKTIVRELTLRRSDPSLQDSRWVVKVGPMGVSVRRYGAAKETARLIGWRALIGIVLTSVSRGNGG